MLQDCDKCCKFATENEGEGVEPMTGPNNLNKRNMKQKTIKKYEVWLTCEQWRLSDGAFMETTGGDFELYPTLDEALQAWTDLSNHRNSREGCKVTPIDREDYNTENSLIRWYVYTNAEGNSFLIRTLIVRKYYYK